MDITIIKHKHTNLDDAKLLRPHIDRAQLVVAESDLSSAAHADKFAQIYAGLLCKESRTQFRHKLWGGDYSPETSEGMVAFTRKFDDDVFRAKKPRLYAEWWSEEDSISMRRRHEMVNSYLLPIFNALCEKNYSEARTLSQRMQDLNLSNTDARDKHIAVQMDRVVERAEKYFGISNLERVSLFVGASHGTEHYLSNAGVVELLGDQRTRIRVQAAKDWREGNKKQSFDAFFVDNCHMMGFVGAGPLRGEPISMEKFRELGLLELAQNYSSFPNPDLR